MQDAEQLNHRAVSVVEQILRSRDALRVAAAVEDHTVIDCGVEAEGGLEAGLALAGVCLSGLGRVGIVGGRIGKRFCPHVEVITDHPVAACLLSQYAGWQIASDAYFGMGSGPMRLAAASEPMLQELGFKPSPVDHAVGVIEAGSPPPEETVRELAEKCGGHLTVLVAPTASQAGNIQVVARSVETAMHKLHELNFDVRRVVSGFGSCPLPPVAKDDLAGIGRTNDAILYGASVVLSVRSEDEELMELGPRIPSNSSEMHGRSFLDLFREAGGDFYSIDKALFSPAIIELHNLNSGNVFRFGETVPELALPGYSAS